MGYSVDRFTGPVPEEFICVICNAVMDDPRQIPQCEHHFCRACIEAWLKRVQSCPVDRSRATLEDLKPAQRALRNMLGRLVMKCIFDINGCQESVTLESLSAHYEVCEGNPDNGIRCDRCELPVPSAMAAQEQHDCVRELRARLREMEETQDRDRRTELQFSETGPNSAPGDGEDGSESLITLIPLVATAIGMGYVGMQAIKAGRAPPPLPPQPVAHSGYWSMMGRWMWNVGGYIPKPRLW